MRAIVLNDGKLTLDANRAEPSIPAGSVRVRVLQAGICETDLQLVAGYMGFRGVLGHEFVGIAESGRFSGQRVVGEINCVCDNCEMCLKGLGNHCPHRTVVGILNHDGAFADHVLIPETNLHRVPDEISDDWATLVEPIAAALQIQQQTAITSGMRCYVVGDGRLGNLCAQALQHADCQVTVIGKHADKLATFEELNITSCLLDEASVLMKADLVVDCAGSDSGLSTAISLVRPRGTIIMKTTVAAEHHIAMAPIVIDEITLIGSRCGPFDRAIEALQQNAFKLDNFISGRFPLEEFKTAFGRATERDALKVILEVSAQES